MECRTLKAAKGVAKANLIKTPGNDMSGDVRRTITASHYQHGGDLLSWLQKAIRRGHLGQHHIDDALYCAAQLDMAGYASTVWNRLLIIASEDVAQSRPTIIIEVRALFLTWAQLKKQNNKHKPERLHLMDAVMRLAMAPGSIPTDKKSRAVDHSIAVFYIGNEKREIPKYVFDKHTFIGKLQGRTTKDFMDAESSDLIVSEDAWLQDAKYFLGCGERKEVDDGLDDCFK